MLATTEVIYCGDNAEVLSKYVPDESVDLVYIDPPFNTGRTFEVFWGEEQEKRAYEDRYGDPWKYLDWMAPRLEQLYRVLKPTGSFYIHCDPTASHYLKVLLDRIFGIANFRNEIIWRRAPAHSDTKQGARHFGRVTDTILFYAKGRDTTWNQIYGSYDQKYVDRDYRRVDHDGRRYRLDNIQGPGGAAKGNPYYEVMGVSRHWRYSKERMEELIRQGRIVQTRPGAVPQYKRYLDEMPGVPLQNLWDDLPPINNRSKELLGYPTQKPVALLERIIRASSNEGDVLLDAFCGCGTSLEAAAGLKRRWIGIDSSPTACRVMADRLIDRRHMTEGRDFRLVDMPRTLDNLHEMPPWEFQNWAVNAMKGVPNRVMGADFGIDGRLYPADRSRPMTQLRDMFGPRDMEWYPIQVKQKAKAGRPEIDSFVAAMHRDRRRRGYFVAFDFTSGAETEVRRVAARDGLEIVLIRAEQLLAEENAARGNPPVEMGAVARWLQRAAPDEGEKVGATNGHAAQARRRVTGGRSLTA